MSLEEKPDNPQESEQNALPPDDFPRWVFDEDLAKAREQELEVIETSSRLPRNVVDLFPLPKKRRATAPPAVEEEVWEQLPEGSEEDEEAVQTGRTLEQLEKARRRQSAYIQKRRAQKRRRVIYSRIRATFKVTSALVLLVLMYSVLTLSFWRFSPEQFSVHGNTLMTREQLAPFIKPLAGMPLYQINPLQLAQTIQAERPYAEHVYVRRHLFPVGLDISIVEKPAWGVLYTTPSQVFRVRHKPGEKPVRVLKKTGREKPMLLLHWDNTTTDLADYQMTPKVWQALGSPVKVLSDRIHFKPRQWQAYRELVALLSSRPKEARLIYLNISRPNDVTAKFEGFNVRIGRLDGSLKARVERLFSVLGAVREHQSEIQWVDLRWHQQVLFKKKSEAQIAAEKQRLAKQKEQPAPLKENAPAVTNLAPKTGSSPSPSPSLQGRGGNSANISGSAGHR